MKREIMNEWISVKERLPEERHYPPVICGHVSDKWTDTAIVNDAGRFINSEGCEIFPTHWMPLPKPPHDDSNNDNPELIKTKRKAAKK